MDKNSDLDIPLDLNKIYTDLAEKLITNTASAVYTKGKSLFKGFGNDLKLKLESSYKDYLACVYERVSKAKSFLIRDESTRLYDFYVPQGISCGEKMVEEVSIFNFVVKNNFAVIKGSAGSGKSMMMRFLFLNCIEKQERVPILIELRRINDFEGSLLEFIKNNLKENKFVLDDDYIEKALKAGHFAIFLDGFDEIAISKRKQLIKEIKKISNNYDKNIIIVSSRPDDEFSSWNIFDVWAITPLTLVQALKLIRKVPSKNIDEETRDKFLKDLEKDLFYRHRSFLSNPLLLSIMTITYASSGDVPQKVSTFYENAYIALFERHDALKGAFKRDRNCNLDILEFKKIFSAFSVMTNSKSSLNEDYQYPVINSLRFPKTDALSFIEEAKKISDVTTDFSSEDFLQDCIKAVCLLIEDGLEITFAHRSFQEYFTAIFISSLDDTEAQMELVNSYFLELGNTTIIILHEFNSSLIEKLAIIPCIENLEKIIKVNKRLTIENYKGFLKYCYDQVLFGELEDDPNLHVLFKQSKNKDGRLMAQVFIFTLKNYASGYFSSILTIENQKKFKKLLDSGVKLDNSASNKVLTKTLYSTIQIAKNSKLLQLLANDENWGFSMKNLKLLFDIKDQLVEKHEKINMARKDNLLKGLRKKS